MDISTRSLDRHWKFIGRIYQERQFVSPRELSTPCRVCLNYPPCILRLWVSDELRLITLLGQ